MLSIISTALLAATLVAGSHDDTVLSRRKHHQRAERLEARNVTERAGGYQVVDRWAGSTFFDKGWDFFTAADPTFGMVNYQSKENAIKKGLAYVEGSGAAVIKVDSISNVGYGANRDSVRMVTTNKYDNGLIILDLAAMPFGCAVWPSFWTVGPNWPKSGEIDIIEGVNDGGNNMYSLHSTDGCQTDTSTTAPAGFLASTVKSKLDGTDCSTSRGGGLGCSWVDNDKASFGSAFNKAGGGVFATQWSSEGIRMWRFPRNAIPADITNQQPNPSSWSAEYLKAAYASSGCAISSFFKQHQIVINLTIGGTWGGNQAIYEAAGCPKTPKDQVMTGSNFANALFKIYSLTVYQ